MSLNVFLNIFITMPRVVKQLLALGVDVFLCAVAVWISFDLLQDAHVAWSPEHSAAFIGSVLLALPLFSIFGIYRTIFRYVGLPALLLIFKVLFLYFVLYSLFFAVIGSPGIPRSVGFLQPLLLLVGIILSRTLIRYLLGGLNLGVVNRDLLPRVLIYGAGSAGRQLAAALKTSPALIMVGFLDDDKYLHGRVLNGLTIYDPRIILDLVFKQRVSQVFLAIPSVSRSRRNEILELVRAAHVEVRTLPGVLDVAQGKVQVSDLKELDIEDLLGRDPVPPDPSILSKKINGKVVMVTGAGGSIGAELCRQILKAGPLVLLMVELTEFALYSIENELNSLVRDDPKAHAQLVPLLANVRDLSRMDEIFITWKPHTVYHAAAYKHVPLVEHNPAEGLKNNVLGTLNIAQLAAKHCVSDFVLISTDKAVRPTNVMGASKRLAEMVLQAQALAMSETNGTTCYSMVRFGNVLGSSGSVVPLFRKQIKDGGPITLTDERITRYFMTIAEAAQLVIQAGAMAKGGDVFVLDMGEPVKIGDLARRMVELSGLTIKDDANLNGDIEIQVTGLRPGEKLYEELLIGDNPLPTTHSRIMKAHEDFLPLRELKIKLADLTHALEANDVPLILSLLKGLVPGYQPKVDVVDWVWTANDLKNNGKNY